MIDPPIAGRVADDNFFRIVTSSIPTYSDWPIWRGSRRGDAVNQHAQIADGWEAFIVSVPDVFWANIEFQRWEPTGRFYLRRLHEDDASARSRGVTPGRTLDLGRAASRVAEAMIAGLAIAKALGCAEEFNSAWLRLSLDRPPRKDGGVLGEPGSGPLHRPGEEPRSGGNGNRVYPSVDGALGGYTVCS